MSVIYCEKCDKTHNPDFVCHQKPKEDLGMKLFELFDKVVINFRAVDRGDILPSDRDRMNKNLADEFLSNFFSTCQKEIVEAINRQLVWSSCIKHNVPRLKCIECQKRQSWNEGLNKSIQIIKNLN